MADIVARELPGWVENEGIQSEGHWESDQLVVLEQRAQRKPSWLLHESAGHRVMELGSAFPRIPLRREPPARLCSRSDPTGCCGFGQAEYG